MSKKISKENRLYFTPPDIARMEEIIGNIKRLSGINRKPTRLKLESCIPTLIACLDNNMSLRNISKVLHIEHKIHAKKDAISNFLNRYELRSKSSNKEVSKNGLQKI